MLAGALALVVLHMGVLSARTLAAATDLTPTRALGTVVIVGIRFVIMPLVGVAAAAVLAVAYLAAAGTFGVGRSIGHRYIGVHLLLCTGTATES
jgi:hypothetical protein